MKSYSPKKGVYYETIVKEYSCNVTLELYSDRDYLLYVYYPSEIIERIKYDFVHPYEYKYSNSLKQRKAFTTICEILKSLDKKFKYIGLTESGMQTKNYATFIVNNEW